MRGLTPFMFSPSSFESYFYDLCRDEIPFAEEVFDVVTFFDVIEHLVSDPAMIFQKVFRLLKEGGCFFITTPNAQFWHRIMYTLWGHRYSDRKNYHEDFAMRHNFIFSVPELKELLCGEKFEIADVMYRTYRELSKEDGENMKGVNPLISEELLRHECHRHSDLAIVARRPSSAV